jgi:hypothetical protein
MLRITILSKGHLVQPMIDGLIANGCEVSHQPAMESWDFQNCDYLLLHGPANPIGPMIRQLRKIRDFPPVVFWYSEQIPSPNTPTRFGRLYCQIRYSMEGWYDEKMVGWVSKPLGGFGLPGLVRWRRVGELMALCSLGSLRLVGSFSQTQHDFLTRLGLPAVVLPFGYHPHFGRRLNFDREKDIVFLGTVSDLRRKRWMPAIKSELEKKNVKLVIIDGSIERGQYYGEERTRLLNRTKILLNIMKQPWDDPLFRFWLASANGALLLSEPVWQTSLGGLVPNDHIAVCNLEQIAETAVYYLNNESARKAVVERAYTEFVEKSTMEKAVEHLLNQLSFSQSVRS